MAKRDNPLAARALAHWARDGFSEATINHITESYGVTSRTLWNWKKALDTDQELSGLFRERLDNLLNRDWAAQLDAALAETVERIRTLIQDAPDLTPVVEAFRALSEVAITREVLRGDANADTHTTHNGAARQDPHNAARPN